MIPVRCRLCGRIRIELPGNPGVFCWSDHPGRISGEVDGMCPRCQDDLEAARERNRRLADRLARAARRRGKRFGPAEEGVDVFQGFREGE